MAIISLSIAALGASSTVKLPMAGANWFPMGGMSFLLNFTTEGFGIPGPVPTAVATVTVQVSNDPLANPNNTVAQQAAARWNNHDVLVGQTTDKNDSVVYPCAYVRLYCTAYTSGTVTLQIGYADASAPM